MDELSTDRIDNSQKWVSGTDMSWLFIIKELFGNAHYHTELRYQNSIMCIRTRATSYEHYWHLTENVSAKNVSALENISNAMCSYITI